MSSRKGVEVLDWTREPKLKPQANKHHPSRLWELSFGLAK